MVIPFLQCSSAKPGTMKCKTLVCMEKIYCLLKDLKISTYTAEKMVWKRRYSLPVRNHSVADKPLVIANCSFTLHPNNQDRVIYTYRFSQCFVSEIFIIIRGNR